MALGFCVSRVQGIALQAVLSLSASLPVTARANGGAVLAGPRPASGRGALPRHPRPPIGGQRGYASPHPRLPPGDAVRGAVPLFTLLGSPSPF